MNTQQFIEYWANKQDHDGSPAVGVGINWNKIPEESIVEQYIGQLAWDKIGNFYPPLWGNFNRTLLKEWLNTNRPDYDKFIEEEKSVGKIQLYDEQGLIYPNFCAFANESGDIGLLVDGSHRFIDFNFLIIRGKDLSAEIAKCKLDVILLNNLNEVLTPIDMDIIEKNNSTT